MTKTATTKTKPTRPTEAEKEARTPKGKKPAAGPVPANSKSKASNIPTAPRQTKKQLLIERLQTKDGADLPTLCNATGWQTHTVRAALSRLKGVGHAVSREPGTDGAPARYRITGSPAAVPSGQPS